MSVASRAPAHIRSLSPYQPGKPVSELSRETGIPEADIVKLASNENPIGMSPKASAAAIAALEDDGARYPDGNAFALKAALAKKYGVDAAQLVIGNGSSDVLEIATQAFLTPGNAAVFSQYSFAVYPLATIARGARCVQVPAKRYGHDLDAMAAAIDDDVRIVFIANPNNPTGTFLPGGEIEAFLARVPPDVLVVLDEAYTEFLPPEKRYDAIAWIGRFPNLLVSRTLCKAYGLAGLRLGYGVAHAEVADLMNRVRQPFNASVIAQAAAAAALEDEDFVRQTVGNNRQGMAQLVAAFTELGLEWIPSSGNFVAVKVGDGEKVNRALLAQGVIVRPVSSYGLPEWLRVSIGLPAENTRFIAALRRALT
jgi:histidinol-phosphate aminotransferase